MPVYQDFGPGIGAGIDAFSQNLVNAMLRKKQLGMQQQELGIRQRAADDAHRGSVISDTINYGFLPEGVKITPDGNTDVSGLSNVRATAAPLPASATPAINPDAFRTMLSAMSANSSGAMPPVAEPIPSLPTSRRAVWTPEQIAASRATDPSAQFEQTMTDAMQRVASPGGSGAGGSASRAGAGAANIPGNPQAGSGAGSRVSIPGVGSVDPMAGFNRQLWLKQREKEIETQAAIDQATGKGEVARNNSETARNLREVNTPRLGDANYASAMGDVERAKALATLPVETQKMLIGKDAELRNATTVEQLRGSIQAGLQHNQQMFDLGKLSQEQKFAADQLVQQQAGSFLNNIGVERYKEGGGLWARGVRAATGGQAAPTTAPSSVAADTRQQREAWDTAATALRAQKKDPDAVLGPRP